MVDDNGGTDNGRTDDGRMPDHGHPISSPCEPNGSGELKILIKEEEGLYYLRSENIGADQLCSYCKNMWLIWFHAFSALFVHFKHINPDMIPSDPSSWSLLPLLTSAGWPITGLLFLPPFVFSFFLSL